MHINLDNSVYEIVFHNNCIVLERHKRQIKFCFSVYSVRGCVYDFKIRLFQKNLHREWLPDYHCPHSIMHVVVFPQIMNLCEFVLVQDPPTLKWTDIHIFLVAANLADTQASVDHKCLGPSIAPRPEEPQPIPHFNKANPRLLEFRLQEVAGSSWQAAPRPKVWLGNLNAQMS